MNRDSSDIDHKKMFKEDCIFSKVLQRLLLTKNILTNKSKCQPSVCSSPVKIVDEKFARKCYW